jgi:hypothetical protein
MDGWMEIACLMDGWMDGWMDGFYIRISVYAIEGTNEILGVDGWKLLV